MEEFLNAIYPIANNLIKPTVMRNIEKKNREKHYFLCPIYVYVYDMGLY